jgi:hypothetical protein
MIKNDLKFPKDLVNLPLKEYQKILQILDENKNDEIKADNKVVQYFTGLSTKEINKLSVSVYDGISNSIANLLKEQPKFEAVFEHKGITYGFIPKLEDMTVGEFLDSEKYLATPEDYHKLMAVLYRPLITIQKQSFLRKKTVTKYEIEEYNGTAKYSEIMKDIPSSYLVGCLVFFWTLNNQLQKISDTSLS